MTIKSQRDFDEQTAKNMTSLRIQRRIAYLKAEGVPIEELITILAFSFQENWKDADGYPTSKPAVIAWLRNLGCTDCLARAIQEIIRPAKYKESKKPNEIPVLVRAEKNLRNLLNYPKR